MNEKYGAAMLKAIEQKPRTAKELALLCYTDCRRIQYAVSYYRRTGVKIIGTGTEDDPYRFYDETYTEDELKEIWRNIRCEEEPYKVLSDFAVCSETEAKRMVKKWGLA